MKLNKFVEELQNHLKNNPEDGDLIVVSDSDSDDLPHFFDARVHFTKAWISENGVLTQHEAEECDEDWFNIKSKFVINGIILS